MAKFYLAILAVFMLACTPSMSIVVSEDLQPFAVELDNVLTAAVAATKIIDFVKSATAFKPSAKDCWVCTLIMTTLEKFVSINDLNIDDFIMNKLCENAPATIKPICLTFVNTYGPTIINTLLQTESPDAACRAIGICNYPECNLIPKGEAPKVSFSPDWVEYFQFQTIKPKSLPEDWAEQVYTSILLEALGRTPNSKIAKWIETLETVGENPFDWLKELIDKISTNHTAIVDFDGDLFSGSSAQLRGYNWRGRDCADQDKSIYPGRKTNPYTAKAADYNCNGISGTDTATSQDYKDLFCGNSGQLGVVVMGDSAGAHAEAPQQWVNASAWGNYTWEDLIVSLANEVDLPHMSAYTGYEDTGYTGPVSSVYKYLYQRNKCNFRDYQNIAVNGLSTRNAHDAIIRLARSQTDDYPILLFLELVGNDVCGSHEDFDHYTSVADFATNLYAILDTIDSMVPPGSHLVTLGLANGSLIFEGVNGKTHPIGVTYNQLYDFQNCLNASMCWGWLNTNQTVRDTTTQRAVELSAVYGQVYNNYTAKNFDWIHYDFPTEYIWNEWTSAGNDPYYLIEPVDGFHPNQMFNSMLGDYIWNQLLTDKPEWLGSVNPNNDKITALFGDQGGY